MSVTLKEIILLGKKSLFSDVSAKEIQSLTVSEVEIFNHLTTFCIEKNIADHELFVSNMRFVYSKYIDLVLEKSITDLSIFDCRDIYEKIVGRRQKKSKQKASERSVEEREREDIDNKIRYAFEVLFLLVVLSLPSCDSYAWSRQEFELTYKELVQNVSAEEFTHLFLFRNVMAIAGFVITPNNNKGLLLDLITRIVEGHTKKYVTGTGATRETNRRVTIYQKEGRVAVVPRFSRRKRSNDEIDGGIVLPTKMHAEAKLSVSNRDIPYSLRDENTSALGGIFLPTKMPAESKLSASNLDITYSMHDENAAAHALVGLKPMIVSETSPSILDEPMPLTSIPSVESTISSIILDDPRGTDSAFKVASMLLRPSPNDLPSEEWNSTIAQFREEKDFSSLGSKFSFFADQSRQNVQAR